MGIDRCERLLLNGQQSSFEEKTTPTYLKFVLVVDLHVAAAPITLQTKPSKVAGKPTLGCYWHNDQREASRPARLLL